MTTPIVRSTLTDALSVWCPICNAAPGTACCARLGERRVAVPSPFLHAARADRAGRLIQRAPEAGSAAYPNDPALDHGCPVCDVAPGYPCRNIAALSPGVEAGPPRPTFHRARIERTYRRRTTP